MIWFSKFSFEFGIVFSLDSFIGLIVAKKFRSMLFFSIFTLLRSIICKTKFFCSEVLVCDDGSMDGTGEVARAAGATVISHKSNKGYGAAIKTIFEAAKKKNVDVLITMDSDEQHDVKDIPKFIKPIVTHEADIVIGSRFLEKESENQIPTYRRLGIKVITKLTQATSYEKITDAQSGFRSYNLKALSKLDLYDDGMSLGTEILLKAKEKNLTIQEVPITISYHQDSSTYNPVTQGVGVVGSILLFVSLRHPLMFYGLGGIVLLVFGMGFMGYSMELFSESSYVSTPLIIIAASFIMVGLILLSTGVILYTLTALLRDKIKEK